MAHRPGPLASRNWKPPGVCALKREDEKEPHELGASSIAVLKAKFAVLWVAWRAGARKRRRGEGEGEDN